jgi:23S rRNA pseudouridine1911/1915/1917 synthase
MKEEQEQGGDESNKVHNLYDSQREDNLFEHYKFVADPGQSVMRIDKFLMERMEKITRNRLQRAIRDGAIKVNDEMVKPNHKIRPGDVVVLLLPDPPEANAPLILEDIPLDIVYEDEDVLVINKKAGMVVHPGVGHKSGTLVNAVAYHLKDQNIPNRDGNVSRPGLVHRIDKDTSGLLVLAKNEHALSHLSKQFYDHTTYRRYYALVWGTFDEEEGEEGTIDLNLGRDPYNRMLVRGFPEGDLGKKSITHYKVLEDMYYVSLVECRLETGRTHQIRVHMKALGHTLFNDKRYGGDSILKGTVYSKYKQFVQNAFKILPRQALHAKSLGFDHPRTGERMMFDSELPEDIQGCLDKWRKYLENRGTFKN